MILWRISRHTLLDGTGGVIVSGRWHTRGRQIVYCSDHPATALLEWIVHLELNADEIPATIPYVIAGVPEGVSGERLGHAALPTDWRSNAAVTQSLGDQWLRSGRTTLLRVPSALVPEAENVLINPAHADARKIGIADVRHEPFDPRLLVGRGYRSVGSVKTDSGEPA